MNSVVVIIMLALAFGLIMLTFRSKKKHKENLRELNEFAHENDALITQSEYWFGVKAKTKIGLDEHTSKLFFIRYVHDSISSIVVDLAQVKGVTKKIKSRTVGEGSQQQTVIETIGLALSFEDPSRKEVFMEFFNTDFDRLSLSGELQTAEKWEEIIRKMVG